MKLVPRYPIYVPSKGRSEKCYTARFLAREGVPFRLVVEPAEAAPYAKRYGEERLLVLPWDNPPGTPDGLIRARNWIRDHSVAAGDARHWQIDDNVTGIWRRWRAKKIRCDAGAALRASEDFADRYENVALAGLNYHMFSINGEKQPPFLANVHVYSCTLVLNSIPYRWRLPYNDDTDLCLQVLSGGWCTILFNAFLAWKLTTMTLRGGNTDALYGGDGRLRMARSLERMWPGVVKVSRRFGRPQHVIDWTRFDQPLRRRPGADPGRAGKNEYGMRLVQVGPPAKHAAVRKLLREAGRRG